MRVVDVMVDKTRFVPRTAVVNTEVMTVMEGPADWVLFPVPDPEGVGEALVLPPPLLVLDP